MNEINFSLIRIHDGSKQGGFEELVCQLAKLSSPKNGRTFIRKEGAGGDAGIECFWILSDEAEHGWQAKYFLDPLSDSQWSQIDESTRTAIDKHPNLKRYTVAVPRDRTDSRKTGSSGKVVKSALDKWNHHVDSWTAYAADRGMSVEFEYWGKHELSSYLQTDSAQFAGRARYWFGSPILTTEDFSRVAESSRASLAERYTPECHTELPITRTLEAVGASREWAEHLHQESESWIKATSKFFTKASTPKSSNAEKLDDLEALTKSVQQHLNDRVKSKAVYRCPNKVADMLGEVATELSRLADVQRTGESYKQRTRRLNETLEAFIEYRSATDRLADFVGSTNVHCSTSRKVLLTGPAGIGKSHLLCDVAMERLGGGQPTVLLLGQHYGGGDPINSMKEKLDLADLDKRTLLGALDAAGEAAGCNALILIDAINEGPYREEWRQYLAAFLADIASFPNVAIVLSCRSTYVDWLVPDHLIGQEFVHVEHRGFRGLEQRAASAYLHKYGIYKPNAPITSPEFSNPLFLKTCCRAIIAQGLTSFPKGVNGISALVDFYIESVEKTVSVRKKYRLADSRVRKALDRFAEQAFPGNKYGIEFSDARSLVESFDTRAIVDDSLFDVLLDEGVLSEDVVWNEQTEKLDRIIARFTYERFADHMISLRQVESLGARSISDAFTAEGAFGPLIKRPECFSNLGVLSSLSVVVAEKYGVELIDLLPKGFKDDDWLFERVFFDSIPWRAPSSITRRTLELLNDVKNYGFQLRQIDALISLSTEPGHPWNADFLHENLALMKRPERDSQWSAHLAVSDSDADDVAPSILRSIIDWAHAEAHAEVDEERMRLCAIVLIWMTSTTNRKVRDQATKSAARVFFLVPSLMTKMVAAFRGVDDLYILERLYASVYGAVTSLSNDREVKEIAISIWDEQFKSGSPTPHLLLRDYCRGVLEYAASKNLLPHSIPVERFRPPYQSEWPLSDLTESELETLVGDKYSSSIRSSVMGFPGDFGNYTMGCVHQWSPTAITSAEPESTYKLQLNFAEQLDSENSEALTQHIKTTRANEIARQKMFENESIEVEIVGASPGTEREETDWERLKSTIESELSAKEREEFRWLMGLGPTTLPGAFSRKKAQRWVCARAFELGWTEDHFAEFDSDYASARDRSSPMIERFGKKYQWVAFHEFLAHLSDNCHYIDRGYSDVDDSRFFGPWQIYARDIDPTCWLRKTESETWYSEIGETWWRPFDYPLADFEINSLQAWLWDKSNLPSFEKLLLVNGADLQEWLVLDGFSNWHEEPEEDAERIPSQDAWYRINSCIVHKSDVAKLVNAVEGKALTDPHVVSRFETGHQRYLREYPWHPAYQRTPRWSEELGHGLSLNIKNMVPVSCYEWERGGTDQSIEDSISIRLPNQEVVDQLALTHSVFQAGLWVDNEGKSTFIDPSVSEKGPSHGLFDRKKLSQWMDDNDLALVWLVGGEKQLFTKRADKFMGRMVFSGCYVLDKSGVQGDMWIKEEHPSKSK